MSDGEYQVKIEDRNVDFEIPVIFEFEENITVEQYYMIQQLEEEYFYEQMANDLII